MPEKPSPTVEYTRRLYDDVRAWYQSADSKAQVALGIDGAFLAFLTSGLFSKPADLRTLVASFSPWTWFFLGLMTLTMLGSIAAAMYCLWSRIYTEAQVQQLVEQARKLSQDQEVYKPTVMWFFQMVGALDPKTFRQTLAKVDLDFEIDAMASEIQILSRNVRKKHGAANVGFLLAAVTLSLFLAAGISYGIKNVL